MKVLHVKKVGFSLSLLFLVVLSDESSKEEYINELRDKVSQECSRSYPITNETREEAKHGILPINENFNCYLKCTFKKFFLLNAMTGINGDALIRLHRYQYDGLINKVVKTCLPIKATEKFAFFNLGYSCESIFGFVNCSINIDKRAIEFMPI